MSETHDFYCERLRNIEKLGSAGELKNNALEFLVKSSVNYYSYNFDWLGLPIIQFPQDMVAIQEIIWRTKPDIIIETGVARGGSLMLSASILHLLNGKGKVIGVDIDIREHNRKAIEAHPLAFRIHLVEGSSIEPDTIQKISKLIQATDKVMVILDSNHTHAHVLKELELYSPWVSIGHYLLVMDTVIENMPSDYFPPRPWGKGNNPKIAVHDFLKTSDRFEIDEAIPNKLLITVAEDGYLKCIK
ncbi:cephalosporin hydroxylase family protein [Rickettsiella endosymbiont of Dermanyssus gallinae]|uniref:cephalosporin hydroxylase family protein n=1 Tax=Rickettsiella endosymbiont of Dermanyssus gallinae TaxID=2856608 RepID=UPI001C52CF12|nr:cephalosporin hydroxylase family protein [Rickettsiella endosymbiont of Dermanyssus gallinae]